MLCRFFRFVCYCRAGACLSALVASIACFPLWLKICHWHIFLTRRARRLRPTPKVSSSSEAKDLGAVNTSVASEILRFAQNDSCGDRRFAPDVKTLHSRISSVFDGFHHGVISSTFGGFHFAIGELFPHAPSLRSTLFPFPS